MKIKCPNCQTDLRYIQSSKLFLCNDCGYHIEGEAEPETPKIDPPVKSHPIFRKYKPWELSFYRFLFLGSAAIAVAVVSMGVSKYQQFKTSQEIDAAIARAKATIEEVKANTINIRELPQVCWPRPHVHLTYRKFQECFVEGVTYGDVATMIGTHGRLVQQSGPMSIYQWGSVEYGMVTIAFSDSRLISKNQINLSGVTTGDDTPPEW